MYLSSPSRTLKIEEMKVDMGKSPEERILRGGHVFNQSVSPREVYT
jgi:hypothetical protein